MTTDLMTLLTKRRFYVPYLVSGLTIGVVCNVALTVAAAWDRKNYRVATGWSQGAMDAMAWGKWIRVTAAVIELTALATALFVGVPLNIKAAKSYVRQRDLSRRKRAAGVALAVLGALLCLSPWLFLIAAIIGDRQPHQPNTSVTVGGSWLYRIVPYSW